LLHVTTPQSFLFQMLPARPRRACDRTGKYESPARVNFCQGKFLPAEISAG
jgi:hypothetical protein